MQLAGTLATLFSILVPARIWYAPNTALNATVKADGQFTLVLTDFSGSVIESKAPADVPGGVEVNLKNLFPNLSMAGTYVLWAAPRNRGLEATMGTPLVISVRADKRAAAGTGVMVTKIEPLRYGVITLEQGRIVVAFYYDSAPHSVETFIGLSDEGFYNELTFHRIVPGFLIQGGDPRSDGKGGPGFTLPAEFNERKHEEGVVAIARLTDPFEPAMKPRAEYADSGGSQFFINLARNEHLDGRYTAFGRVVDGMNVVKALAATPLDQSGRPRKPPVIQKIEIRPVTARDNPYRAIFDMPKPAEAK